MKTLYLDIFSGLSGDMFIGALVDLGVDSHHLEHELEKLGIGGYHLHVSRQERGKIAGTKFDVHLEDAHPGEHEHHVEHAHSQPHSHSHSTSAEDHNHHQDEHQHHEEHQHHDHGGEAGHAHAHEHENEGEDEDEHEHEDEHGRSFSQIRDLIRASSLSPWVKEKAQAVFHRIAVAEGKIHGKPPAKVHFHEVGAVDSIVDIVGACIGLELLGRPRVLSGPVVEGVGFVQCAHGRFPLPAPATLEILSARGIAIHQTDEPAELLTPTGAALLAEFAEGFGAIAGLKVDRIGYGLGGRENRTRPNVVRALLGESVESSTHDWERDEVAVLETNLDDVSPEILGAFLEKAMGSGALDVFYTAIQMKKSRPGVVLSVLCASGDADRFTEMILRDTTAFGVRRSVWERRKLRREVRVAKTSLGDIQVKLGWLDGKIVQASPEYESCKQAADLNGVPLREAYDLARRAFI